MKIVFLIEKNGDHCNRLFQSLHFHAFCLNENSIFINLSLLGIIRFDNKVFNILDKLNNILLKFISNIIFINKDKKVTMEFPNISLEFVRGSNFRVNSLTQKYHEKLKLAYDFKSNDCLIYASKIKKYIGKLNSQNKFVIGLHIRKGDYNIWNNGDYYFDDNTYNKIIKSLRKQFLKKKIEVFIVVVSNEKVSSDLDFDYFAQGTWREDLITLQNCELLVGPPSTFTMWASYISQIPLIQIDKNGKVFLDNKSICIG